MRIPDFRLERFFARWEFVVRHVLTASDVEPVPMAELLALADDEMRRSWDGLLLGYTETAGDPRLRAAVADLFGAVAPDEVIVTSGAQEGIFLLVNAVVRPGDHVVAVEPAYQSLHEVARAAGADVETVSLRYEDAWRLDLDRLEAALRRDTRLVVVNTPHNPTGSHLTREELERLVTMSDARGAVLLCDEVYRLTELDAPPLPPAADLSAGAVSLGVMSKPFGLAGLRIGWLAVRDRELRRRVSALKDYTTICASAPSELLAIMALRSRDTLLQRTRAIVAANRAVVQRFIDHHAGALEWVPPSAGTVAFPRLLLGEDADTFAARLAEEEGVLLAPASCFGESGNHVRIGLGRRDVPDALERLGAFLER